MANLNMSSGNAGANSVQRSGRVWRSSLRKEEKSETTTITESRETKKKEFKKFTLQDKRCYNCGKPGHIARAWLDCGEGTPARPALVERGSSDIIVPATLAKEAGWKLLPYQVFAKTLTEQEVRNEGVVELEITLADSEGKEQRFRELAVASPDVSYITLGMPWLERHDSATLWGHEGEELAEDGYAGSNGQHTPGRDHCEGYQGQSLLKWLRDYADVFSEKAAKVPPRRDGVDQLVKHNPTASYNR
ncbi:hypothetical protein GB937_006329 [Aspergillus fischeri]|nr:hypothetical protein GB937_006329 [Aspergillus fischeri]